MTKLTKVSNFILRGTIIAALGATIIQASSAFSFFKGIDTVNTTAEAWLSKAGSMNFSQIISAGNIITLLLAAAVILSIVSFKCSGTVSSVFRTITLSGMALLSLFTAGIFDTAAITFKSTQGIASAAELARIQPIIEHVTFHGSSQSQLAGGLAVIGLTLTCTVAFVLAILFITSIVSMVKTVKAPVCEA